jgi:hypothetical protein
MILESRRVPELLALSYQWDIEGGDEPVNSCLLLYIRREISLKKGTGLPKSPAVSLRS